ncbi:MAG: four helix bundle protein [Pirellulaceae bacterium]|nr:MAG: four helix bundle protein [Pirellulaceae bacterium]
MSKIHRFEDIQAWQEARSLTKDVYAASGQGRWEADYALKGQIRRAGISIMSNIAEGIERRTDTEFARFLAMAKGTASEVKAQLYIALDQGYIDQERFNDLYERCDKVSRYLGSFIRYLRRNDARCVTHVTQTRANDARRTTHDPETQT